MEIGKVYRKRQDLTYNGVPCNPNMPFGEQQGIFIGYTKQNMPRFQLSKGRECFINLTDECFEEVV